MRVYPTEDDFPDTPREAHKFVLRAMYHLWNREAVELETLDARCLLNTCQIDLSGEITK